MEAPSHLREHQDPVKLTLLAALLYCGSGRSLTRSRTC